MAWNSYGLDQVAQKLVLTAQKNDPDSLNQSYKMRMAVAYGLERFWGEHLRLQGKQQMKADYWKATWDALVHVMAQAGVIIPNDSNIELMANKLWGEVSLDGTKNGPKLTLDDQRVTLAVLTQLCDCLVWWTQRYKN